MGYFSTNIIDVSEVSSYAPFNKINDYQQKTCKLGDQEYRIKQVFAKDSNIVSFALRCFLGAILIVPAKCLGLLLDRKFEWIESLFNRKNLYLVIDKNDGLLVKSADYFVEALNATEYAVNGKVVNIPAASMPIKVSRNHAVTLQEEIAALKASLNLVERPHNLVYKDKSTEEAINERNGMAKIALNFANESHAGGGPGFHKDPITGLFVYDCQSAKAQEESMCQRSTLMGSLTQLPHVLVSDGIGSKMVRSYYTDSPGSKVKTPFDSRKEAYVSDNHLFAVQHQNQFYGSEYLEEPQAVSFITSAADYYGSEKVIDTSENSAVYLDAQQRIETHLYASAVKAVEMKQNNPEQPVELILGAYGCGAFAPQDFDSANNYRLMIGSIYKKLLPEFNGFFDQVTFAVPTFGVEVNPDLTKNGPAVLNNVMFKRAMMS